MFEKLEIVRMAQAFAVHAGARQGEVSRNIANADTPNFKARDLPPFDEAYHATGQMRGTRPGHFGTTAEMTADDRLVGGAASPNGNTVSLEAEMVKAVELRQQHEMALAIYRSTSSVLRSSLGRGR